MMKSNPGFIKLYILHTLKKSPKSGYEIISEIKEKCENKWSPSKGTLYPLLDQMKKEKLIKIKKIEKRSKNVFEITKQGEKHLSEILNHNKEKLSQFRNLFIEIIGEEKAGIISILFEIKEKALMSENKKDVIRTLKKCLDELK